MILTGSPDSTKDCTRQSSILLFLKSSFPSSTHEANLVSSVSRLDKEEVLIPGESPTRDELTSFLFTLRT